MVGKYIRYIQMSRDPNYQRLLNSKRWKMLRQEYLRAHPLCERCKADGLIRSAIDVHHKVPVESAHTLMEMEQLAFDWHNLQVCASRATPRLTRRWARTKRRT